MRILGAVEHTFKVVRGDVFWSKTTKLKVKFRAKSSVLIFKASGSLGLILLVHGHISGEYFQAQDPTMQSSSKM